MARTSKIALWTLLVAGLGYVGTAAAAPDANQLAGAQHVAEQFIRALERAGYRKEAEQVRGLTTLRPESPVLNRLAEAWDIPKPGGPRQAGQASRQGGELSGTLRLSEHQFYQQLDHGGRPLRGFTTIPTVSTFERHGGRNSMNWTATIDIGNSRSLRLHLTRNGLKVVEVGRSHSGGGWVIPATTTFRTTISETPRRDMAGKVLRPDQRTTREVLRRGSITRTYGLNRPPKLEVKPSVSGTRPYAQDQSR